MTTNIKDQPQVIPAREATLLRLAEQPGATIELSKKQEACAREVDERVGARGH